MISLRRMDPGDAALLSTIGSISLKESHGHSAPEATMQEYLDDSFTDEVLRKELEDEKNIFYLAAYNDQPAGYFKITLQTSTYKISLKPITKLSRLYLLKEFYGLSVADQLFKKIIETSKAGGDKGIWLNVWIENPRAIRFYEKQGFKIVGESMFRLTADHSNPNWLMLLEY